MGEDSRNLCLPTVSSTKEGHARVVILLQLEDLKER